jgi:hypothetical protein
MKNGTESKEVTEAKDAVQNNKRWVHKWIETIAHGLQQPETQKWMHAMILDPLVSYIMSRVFPYVILTIILFAMLFILVILIFVMLLFRENGNKYMCGLV